MSVWPTSICKSPYLQGPSQATTHTNDTRHRLMLVQLWKRALRAHAVLGCMSLSEMARSLRAIFSSSKAAPDQDEAAYHSCDLLLDLDPAKIIFAM